MVLYIASVTLDPSRTVAELRELQQLTGDENGAQRVCWANTWAAARAWMREKLAALPVEVEVDEAGNQWGTLRGESERAVLIGSHLDSVPNGGWLDGCLGVVAGARGAAPDRRRHGTPPVTVRARRLGRRRGRALRPQPARVGGGGRRSKRDECATCGSREGTRLADALAENGVDARSDARRAARAAADRRAAPISSCTSSRARCSSRCRSRLGVVLGTFGVERHRIRFAGQAAHSGSTPIPSGATRSRPRRSSHWRSARSRSGQAAARSARWEVS